MREIGIPLEDLGWAILTNSGPILVDEDGGWWLGGSRLCLAIFKERRDAQKAAAKILRESEMIEWTKTIPASRVFVRGAGERKS